MKWEGLKKEAPKETPLASPGSPPAWTSLGESVVLPPLYLEVQDAFMRLLKHVQRRTVALAAAAHELKTPLTIITGYTEFLLSEKAGPLNEPQRRALMDSQENCRRLQRFIQDVLTYSALETGKIPMKFEEWDVGACLEEVYEVWLRLFHEKGVSLYYLTRAQIEKFQFDFFNVQQSFGECVEVYAGGRNGLDLRGGHSLGSPQQESLSGRRGAAQGSERLPHRGAYHRGGHGPRYCPRVSTGGF